MKCDTEPRLSCACLQSNLRAVAAPVVAVIKTSPDTVELLSVALEGAGFVTVSSYTHDIRDGRVDLAGFLSQHQPTVVVYDIAPPYERN
jgi:hypothetical protein